MERGSLEKKLWWYAYMRAIGIPLFIISSTGFGWNPFSKKSWESVGSSIASVAKDAGTGLQKVGTVTYEKAIEPAAKWTKQAVVDVGNFSKDCFMHPKDCPKEVYGQLKTLAETIKDKLGLGIFKKIGDALVDGSEKLNRSPKIFKDAQREIAEKLLEKLPTEINPLLNKYKQLVKTQREKLQKNRLLVDENKALLGTIGMGILVSDLTAAFDKAESALKQIYMEENNTGILANLSREVIATDQSTRSTLSLLNRMIDELLVKIGNKQFCVAELTCSLPKRMESLGKFLKMVPNVVFLPVI